MEIESTANLPNLDFPTINCLILKKKVKEKITSTFSGIEEKVNKEADDPQLLGEAKTAIKEVVEINANNSDSILCKICEHFAQTVFELLFNDVVNCNL